MENKQHINLEDVNKELPFSIPDNYFEDFEKQILAQTVETARPVSLWQRSRVWVYAAAMIAGIFFITKTAINITTSTEPTITTESTIAQNEATQTAIEEYELSQLTEEQLIDLILAYNE